MEWKIYVSADAIDYGLTYRLIEPGYEVFSKMGIYQRELASYKEYLSTLPATSALPCVQANMKYSGSFPNVTGSAQIRNLIVEYLNSVVDNRMTAEDAVKQLEAACNKALQQ